MEKEFDSILDMTRFWIDIYKKIKNGTATKEETEQLDKFTFHYLDYIATTGSFYVSGRYICPSGYKMGIVCDKYKERLAKSKLRQSTILRLDSLGFFWGKKDTWHLAEYNINPIRREIIRLLDIEYLLTGDEKVIYTYVIDNVTYANIRDIEHKGKLNEFWNEFWEHYADYVNEKHSSFIPDDYICPDGYELGNIAEGLRQEYENKTMTRNVYNWLNSIGFGWNPYSSTMEILKYNIDTNKRRLNIGREKVIKRYIDPVNVDNFCLHYLHYVASTNNYDTPVDYVCQDGYKLGENAVAYQKLYEMGNLPSTAIKCLNVLSFPLPEPKFLINENEGNI